jgi:hypothetical protein
MYQVLYISWNHVMSHLCNWGVVDRFNQRRSHLKNMYFPRELGCKLKKYSWVKSSTRFHILLISSTWRYVYNYACWAKLVRMHGSLECQTLSLEAPNWFATFVYQGYTSEKLVQQRHDNTTLNMIFSVTEYMELRNAISIYCTSHILWTNNKLVVWTL